MSCDDILEFGRQILTHLYVIHSAGYVHNDLKPDNLMINGSNLQIIDFGFASRYRSKDDRRHLEQKEVPERVPRKRILRERQPNELPEHWPS